MDDVDCQRIVAGAFSVLPPDGDFLQFTYGPASPVSRRTRASLGIAGQRSDWVLFNLPPAAVWRYHREPAAADIYAS
jgi:phosphatidylethanolamine/phosphatidyl-N-methylethanolamine N-methyltransferase